MVTHLFGDLEVSGLIPVGDKIFGGCLFYYYRRVIITRVCSQKSFGGQFFALFFFFIQMNAYTALAINHKSIANIMREERF